MYMQYCRNLRMLMTSKRTICCFTRWQERRLAGRRYISSQAKTEPHVHAFEECSLLLELPFGLAYEDSKVCHRLHHLQCGRLLISTVDWHY